MHRAEQIMAKVETLLTGLTTTGANVVRGRAKGDTFDEGVSDALTIRQGSDVPFDESPFPLIHSTLTVYVDLHTTATSELLDTRLNLIRSEVTIALETDNTLGLPFVIDIEERATGEPDETDEGNKPASVITTSWEVKYSRNYGNPG